LRLEVFKTGLRFFENKTYVWKLNYENKIAGKRK